MASYNVSSRALSGKLLQFKDSSGKLRYGVALSLRSDWMMVGQLPAWWLPGSSAYVPRKYVALWGIPFTAVVQTLANRPQSDTNAHAAP
jgi:hypothetical protein